MTIRRNPSLGLFAKVGEYTRLFMTNKSLKLNGFVHLIFQVLPQNEISSTAFDSANAVFNRNRS